jgi:pyruvate dehydrogenase E1 component beta subunit
MLEALADDNPVVFIDDRSLYALEGPVPELRYRTPIGSARIARPGRDLSIIACSELVPVALEAARLAAAEGCSAEVVDLRSLRPLDRDLILGSVARTGRVLVCDPGWTTGGIGAEVVATIAEAGLALRAAPRRIGLPDCPAPAARSLEAAYYPDAERLRNVAFQVLESRRPMRRTSF